MASVEANRVFSKITPNGKISLFMSQREFVNCLAYTQPVDGAIVVDRDYIHPDRSIAVQLISVLRYGREDDEVMGLNLSKELCLANVVVNKASPPENLTKMQENLNETYGETCFPFRLEWPQCIGPSMTIQQPHTMKGEPCGIKHFIEVFCIYRGNFQPHKRSSIHFDIDLIQTYGLAKTSAVWIPPAVSISRPLFFALGHVDMEVCLEKTSINDGEPLPVNISIVNQSNKVVRGMKVKLFQFYKLSFSEGKRKKTINYTRIENGFPVAPGGTLNQTVTIIPRVPLGLKQDGVAVHRSITSKNLQLAASTLFPESIQAGIFGFIISYRLRVKLSICQSPLKSSVVTEVPVYITAKKNSEPFPIHRLAMESSEKTNIGPTGSEIDYAVNLKFNECNR